jgi:hypothetical protein
MNPNEEIANSLVIAHLCLKWDLPCPPYITNELLILAEWFEENG